MDVIGVVAGWLVSSGLLLWGGKLWIERRLARAQREADDKLEDRRRRYALDDEYRHAVGRFLFWTQKGAARLEQELGKAFWNGDLQTAYDAVQTAEDKRKELDRKQLAEVNEE